MKYFNFTCLYLLFAIFNVGTNSIATMKLFRGKMLERSQIMKFKMPTLYQCATICLSIKQCMSINFHRGQKMCHINDKDVLLAEADQYIDPLKTDITGDYTYIERKDIPKGLSGNCGNHTCDEKEICKENKDGGKPSCMSIYQCTDAVSLRDSEGSSFCKTTKEFGNCEDGVEQEKFVTRKLCKRSCRLC